MVGLSFFTSARVARGMSGRLYVHSGFAFGDEREARAAAVATAVGNLHNATIVAVLLVEARFAGEGWETRCAEAYDLDALRHLDALIGLLCAWQDEEVAA